MASFYHNSAIFKIEGFLSKAAEELILMNKLVRLVLFALLEMCEFVSNDIIW